MQMRITAETQSSQRFKNIFDLCVLCVSAVNERPNYFSPNFGAHFSQISSRFSALNLFASANFSRQ